MPVIISAKKKLRADLRKQKVNQAAERALKLAVKNFKVNLAKDGLKNVYSALDTAAKKGIISKKGAARKKSNLANLFLKKARPEKIETKNPKKATGRRKAAIRKL
jgi:ribosomal protein S20